MPRNRNKTRCSVAGCRAWAIHGSDPPRCSPHSDRAGAPPANQNRLVHGFYASALHGENLSGLLDGAEASLDAEVAIVRLALRRVLSMLVTGATPGPNPQPLTADDYARFIGLTFQGAGAISRLLRTSHALSADRPTDLETLIVQAFDALGEEDGRDL